jgi:uncharacterized protein YbjT (DUF2867 family)
VIVVTGSTGHVGRLVAAELAARGEATRLVVRDPARAPDLPGAGVVVGDYGEPETVSRALHKGDRVFMVSLHEGPARRIPLHRSFVETAARRGVAQIVYLSFLNAGPDAHFLHARSHGATEEMLAESGVPYTSIRNGMYADDIPGWFDADGVLREPGEDAEITFSYRPELAEAIAVTLTDDGHENTVYNVTTPAVTLAELADTAAQVTGRPYRYEPQTDADWDARWRAAGRSGWELVAGQTSYDALRAGELSVGSDDYRLLTGKQPLTAAELLARHAHELPL